MNANRLWVIGTAIVTIAVLALGWFLGVSPKLAEAALSSSRSAEVDETNVAHEQELLKLQKQFEEIDALRAALKKSSSSIPATTDIQTFLRDINSLAKRVGVSVDSVVTGEAAAFTLPEGAPTDGPASLVDPARFISIPVTIKFGGVEREVLRFAEGMQKGDRLFFVQEFSLAAEPEKPVAEGETATEQVPGAIPITGELVGYIYVLLPDKAAIAPLPSEEEPAEEEPAEEEPEPAASEEPAPVETPAGEETPAAEETPAVEETPAP